jgi:transposase InsO family protein
LDEKLRAEIALFRFSLIAPLLQGTHTGSKQGYLSMVEAKEHLVPGIGTKTVSASSVRRWLLCYRRYGLDGLKPKPRSDRGLQKNLGQELAGYIIRRKQEAPRLTASAIYRELMELGLFGASPPSLSTFIRFTRQVLPLVTPVEDRKRFGFPYANDCWQTDIAIGPYLRIDGRKVRTYLIAFLDDASRLIPTARFYLTDNFMAFSSALKLAIQKRGIPKRLYTDRGRIFMSLALRIICARLGIVLSHAEPYSPESKGKIERAFRTIRMQFLDPLDPEQVASLEDLNDHLTAYLEGSYQLTVHQGIGQSPQERYLRDQGKLRFIGSQAALDQAFLHEATRKVNNDATISLEKQVYELPAALIGHKVKVLFSPEDTSTVYLEQAGVLTPYYPVRPLDNAKLPREKKRRTAIDYEALYGGKKT